MKTSWDMKKTFAILCAAALLAGCSTNTGNGGPTVFQGRFIGYTNEFVEFFLPTDDGDFQEIQVHVQPDGTFCDTIQFDRNLYDAALFADKFMFRISVEQGKTYDTEFDITEEGVETNFRFIGEGAAENTFMAHLWGIDEWSVLEDPATFQEFKGALQEVYAPLREELKTIPNKPFVKYYDEELDGKLDLYACYFPFFAAARTGDCPDDPDFNAYVAKRKKLSDEEFRSAMERVCTNVPYTVQGLTVTEALKAAASCSVNPQQQEWAMAQMMASMVSAGSINGLDEGYDYFASTVKNEDYLDQVYELCNNAMLLVPGSDAPDIEFEDRNGFLFNLSDFFGQPIYIDLWASWCGPCCEEIPHLAKFVESLGDPQEISVLSISIDDNLDDWLNKLDEIDAGWAQFIATEEGQASISNNYFVSSIPRFILIDANGKIASVNAPRPSTPNLLEELKALL